MDLVDLPSVGVEEEFLLVDPESGIPVPVAADVLDKARSSAPCSSEASEWELQAEVSLAQVETATPVCRSPEEVADHLRCSRRSLTAAAAANGVILAPVGAAPFGRPDATITPKKRYLAILHEVPALLEEQLVNGMHVHVQVPSRAAGVDVMNRLRPRLHLLLALTANSPLWHGRDTGFASWRSVHSQRWPVEGPPPYCHDEADHERRVQSLLATGVIMDRGMLYWHVRISERYPTVEVRAADVAIDVETAATYAGLVRAIVVHALREGAAGIPAPNVDPELLRAASWQAARHGLGGDLLDLRRPSAAQPRMVPAGQAIRQLATDVCWVLPPAEERAVLTGVDVILASGGGAARQREALASAGRAGLLGLLAQCSDPS